MNRKQSPRRPPVESGTRITVRPEKLVAGGESLSRVDGFPVFVRGLYPGDTAEVQLTEVRSGFARGSLIEVRSGSPLRRREPCPIARECGGCDWTELRLDAQLDAKRAIVIESLTRIGRIADSELPPITIHPSPLNYRIRSRLHADETTGRLGFFAIASHDVIPLSSECEVVGPLTRAVAPHSASKPGVDVIFYETEDGLLTGTEEGLAGNEAELVVGGRVWSAPATGFFQVNRHLAGRMQELVGSIASTSRGRELAYDLYGGAGFFAAPLARHFKRVISVEAHPAGHRAARRNLQTIDGAIADSRSAEKFMRSAGEADMIFLDPPRAGASDEVLAACAGRAREIVCYLSCDPVTFSRDASRLLRRGWRLDELHLLDLFPNTSHVETLAAFRRA